MDLFTPSTNSKLPRKRVNKASKPIFDDLPNWRPKGTPRHHIFQQYFTPAERRGLKAIPKNDVTSEIQLLRILLARCFAMVPRYPHDNKIPALLEWQLAFPLLNLFSNLVGSFVPLSFLTVKISRGMRQLIPLEVSVDCLL